MLRSALRMNPPKESQSRQKMRLVSETERVCFWKVGCTSFKAENEAKKSDEDEDDAHPPTRSHISGNEDDAHPPARSQKGVTMMPTHPPDPKKE